MAVLVDVSQVLISAASIGFKNQGQNLTESMIRNMFLNSIKSINTKHVKKFGGPLILAFDGKGYWRKKKYPYYKYKRASGREESPMNWELIFETLHKLHDELKENFSYHVIKVNGAEADDVISVLAKYFNENELQWSGVMEVKQPVLIVSADQDFIQLQAYDNVQQYFPTKRKMIRENNPVSAKYEKIIRGDTGDGIVNIFSDSNCLVDGIRQKSATAIRVEPILESLNKTGMLPPNLPEDIVKNYERNKMLIDLVDLQLPEEIANEIIKTYKDVDNSNKGKGLIYNYLAKHNLKNFLRDIDKF